MASIYPRGKNYWIKYRTPEGTTERKPLKEFNNGKPVQDEKYAKYLKNKIENELLEGANPLPAKTKRSAQDILNEYMSSHKNRVKATTCNDIRSYCERYFKFSNVKKIDQVSAKNVETFASHLIDLGKKKDTANHMIGYVKQLINYCVKQGYLAQSPLNDLKKYKIDDTTPTYLSIEEIETVLKHAKNYRLYKAILMAIYTGMDPTDIEALKTENYNLKTNTINFVRAKTGKVVSIPIHKRLRAEIGLKDFPIDMTNIKRQFLSIRDKCQNDKDHSIEWFVWKTFRHTFASHLVMNGVDITTVSKLLGHTNIKTTMIYSHLSTFHIQNAIEKLPY